MAAAEQAPDGGRAPLVVVATLTFRRPAGLTRLLDSLAALVRPTGFEVRFLVVDNDPDGSARETVAAQPGFAAGELAYVVEPEPGIPAARNRALDEALGMGARFLCFIDDDETATPQWLCRLLAHQEKTGAVLVGGPARYVPETEGLTRWQRRVRTWVVAYDEFARRSAAGMATRGKVLKVSTANWLGDLRWIAAQGLRFDIERRFTGGSDTAFLNDVVAQDGKVSWCATAETFEHVPVSRLSLGYQFRRFRSYGLNMARPGRKSRLFLFARHSVWLFSGPALMMMPVFGRASPMIGLHMLGVATGFFSGLVGRRSALYLRKT